MTYLTRSTVYRILVRRRLHHPKPERQETHTKRYTKSYPGEEIQIDTTEPFGKGNGTQISAIDDYSRWGFADFYQRNTSLNAALFLTACIQSAPFPIRAVRTDHGSEFYGVFQATCKRLGITIIRNRVNTPEHNGKVERFHRTIEEECLWRTRAESEHPESVRFQLNRYLVWYNTKRRHGGIGMNKATPQEKIEEFILSTQVHPFIVDVNETLILYKNVKIFFNKYNCCMSNADQYIGPTLNRFEIDKYRNWENMMLRDLYDKRPHLALELVKAGGFDNYTPMLNWQGIIIDENLKKAVNDYADGTSTDYGSAIATAMYLPFEFRIGVARRFVNETPEIGLVDTVNSLNLLLNNSTNQTLVSSSDMNIASMVLWAKCLEKLKICREKASNPVKQDISLTIRRKLNAFHNDDLLVALANHIMGENFTPTKQERALQKLSSPLKPEPSIATITDTTQEPTIENVVFLMEAGKMVSAKLLLEKVPISETGITNTIRVVSPAEIKFPIPKGGIFTARALAAGTAVDGYTGKKYVYIEPDEGKMYFISRTTTLKEDEWKAIGAMAKLKATAAFNSSIEPLLAFSFADLDLTIKTIQPIAITVVVSDTNGDANLKVIKRFEHGYGIEDCELDYDDLLITKKEQDAEKIAVVMPYFPNFKDNRIGSVLLSDRFSFTEKIAALVSVARYNKLLLENGMYWMDQGKSSDNYLLIRTNDSKISLVIADFDVTPYTAQAVVSLSHPESTLRTDLCSFYTGRIPKSNTGVWAEIFGPAIGTNYWQGWRRMATAVKNISEGKTMLDQMTKVEQFLMEVMGATKDLDEVKLFQQIEQISTKYESETEN